MKIAWISTAVLPYSEIDIKHSSAATNDCLKQLVEGLQSFGVESTLLLPEKSDSKCHHIVFEGSLQNTVAVEEKVDSTGTVTGSVLSQMMDWAWNAQDSYDLIVNIGHDYLPIFMVGKFRTPFITLPNLCSTTQPMDDLIRKRALAHPSLVWFSSHAQRLILGNNENPILTQSFDTTTFPVAAPIDFDTPLGWAGRIVKEKGLRRSAQIAQKLNRRLWVAGPIHDEEYLDSVLKEFPTNIDYLGCISRQELFAKLSNTAAFLQTQKPGWDEAFGRITAEALLAGCPVLYDESGANAELAKLTGGGVLINNNDIEASFNLALSISRIIIQQNAREQFDRYLVAKRFLQIAQKIHPRLDHAIRVSTSM